MSILNFWKKKPEIRAETPPEEIIASDVLLRALLDKSTVTKEMALQIPTVQACINIIANTISKLPVRLYKRTEDGVEIIEKDPRLKLLNDDTGDTLTAKQFWRAMLEDYFLGKGGFAYINGDTSIHYVDEENVSIGWQNYDPIFKEYDLLIMGRKYYPSEFLKLLRKTRDGMTSRSIVEDNPLLLSVAYTELKFELAQATKGGTKRGFLQADKALSQNAIDSLKAAFRRLYGSSDENVVVLNNGVKFQEASATNQELQMNENKASNAEEICKLFGVPLSMISGSKTGNSMTENDTNQFIKTCVAIMTDIECSLNRDFLHEEEKEIYYWSFDTKELTRGSIKERYEAYKIGLDKNFLQIDEVRAKEDMEPLGIDWMLLNLNTVFYDTNTKQIYTPNTNASMNLATGAGANTASVSQVQTEEPEQPAEEERADEKNIIVVGPPGSGKTTWVRENMKPGDIVLDLDKIRSTLLGTTEEHQDAPELAHILSMIGWAVRKGVEEGDIKGKAFIITSITDRQRLQQWADQINAEMHVMEATAEECKDRIKEDPNRPDEDRMYDLVDQWFSEWEGGEKDESGTES